MLTALRATGLAAVGIAAAEPFDTTREDLLRRRAAGLHGGMRFTYRNPDRCTQPASVLGGARSLVVGAMDYLSLPPPPVPTARARVARYAWTESGASLTASLAVGATILKKRGFRAVIVSDQNSLVDREAARRAGIGFYGHNANILLREGGGSWVVLGAIVTDAPLTPSNTVAPSDAGCGACTRCMDLCPTGAIVDRGVVDARRCLSWLLQAPGVFPRELRVALGDRIYGCDDCQEVCPPNIARARRDPVAAPEAGARAWVDVADLLDEDDAVVLAAARRWYVWDRDARYLRRNALIVLANTADPGDAGAVALVERALADADPLVRAHAVWAAARLGRPELADGLTATEADAMVREELDHVAEVPARR